MSQNADLQFEVNSTEGDLKFEFTGGDLNVTAHSHITAVNGNVEFTSAFVGDVNLEAPLVIHADGDIHLSRPVWVEGEGEMLFWADRDADNNGTIWCDGDAKVTTLSEDVRMTKYKAAKMELVPKDFPTLGWHNVITYSETEKIMFLH